MTGFFIKKAFFDGWDNLLTLALFNIGYVVIIVMILAAPTLSPSSLPVTLTLLLISIFLFYLYSGGVARFLGELSFDRGPELRQFFTYVRKTWRTSVTLASITSIQLIVLAIGFPFYLSMGGVFAMAALSILFWVSVLWYLVSLWVYPVSVQLETSVKMQLKKSLILFLDNSGFTLFLAIYTLFNFAFSVATAFLIPGFAGIRLSRQIALKLRMYKYDYLEEHPNSQKQPIPWGALLVEEREKIGRRSLKGMVFPWKD
jgi:uncharacterized membrane protein YesL